MYIGIKDGKLYDICSKLQWKRDDSIKNEDYLDLEIDISKLMIGDTHNPEDNTFLEDSPQRNQPLPDWLKSKEQLKIEQLEVQINEMNLKIKDLEKK